MVKTLTNNVLLNECVEIDSSLNCLDIDGENCLQCKEGFALKAGKCS